MNSNIDISKQFVVFSNNDIHDSIIITYNRKIGVTDTYRTPKWVSKTRLLIFGIQNWQKIDWKHFFWYGCIKRNTGRGIIFICFEIGWKRWNLVSKRSHRSGWKLCARIWLVFNRFWPEVYDGRRRKERAVIYIWHLHLWRRGCSMESDRIHFQVDRSCRTRNLHIDIF